MTLFTAVRFYLQLLVVNKIRFSLTKSALLQTVLTNVIYIAL